MQIFASYVHKDTRQSSKEFGEKDDEQTEPVSGLSNSHPSEKLIWGDSGCAENMLHPGRARESRESRKSQASARMCEARLLN